MRSSLLFALTLTVFVFGAADASAECRDDRGFDLLGGTAFPLHVGVSARWELPCRLYLRGGIGWMPDAYVSTIALTVEPFLDDDDPTDELIRSSLDDAMLIDAGFGFRPSNRLGLEFGVAYTFAGLGGGLSGSEAVEAVTDITLPVALRGTELPIASKVHSFNATVGWRFVLGRHITLRTGVGYFQSLAATTRVDVNNAPVGTGAVLEEVSARLDRLLDETYARYVKFPFIYLELGWHLPRGRQP